MPFASKVAFVGGAATLPPQIVTPPLNLTGTAGDGNVTLRWVPSPTPSTTAVRVYRDEQLVATLGRTVTLYRDDNLTNGQGYRYSLEAVRNEVVSKRTDVLTLTPTSLDLDLEPPTGFRAAKRDGAVRLFWTPSISDGVEGIYVYQDGVIVATAAPDATTTVVLGLNNGQSYAFRLAAFMDGGVSVQTEVDTVVPGAELISIAPPTVSGTAGDGKVTLNWTRSTTSGVTSYEVYLFNQFLFDAGNVTTVTLNDLTNGEHYTCKVLAYKDGDRSPTDAVNTYEAYPRGSSPEPDPITDMSPYGLKCLDVGDWSLNRFSGERLTHMKLFDVYLDEIYRSLPGLRAGNKAWSGSTNSWPSNCYDGKGTSKSNRVSFGAYVMLRIAMSGKSNRQFFATMLSKHPGYVDAAYKLLDRAISQLLNAGSVKNHDVDDGWLGWRYGTSGNFGTIHDYKDLGDKSEAGKHIPLENALNNGTAQMPYILWINRDTRTAAGYTKEQKLKLMNQGRAYFKQHHIPRWLEQNGTPSPTRPTICRKNFAHADLSEALSDLVFAQLETDMFVNGYRNTITVDMPDGFNNQKVSLERGTSADVRTHPWYQRAIWIFNVFRGEFCLRTAYGSDIRNSAMRGWYGDCGATYWGQRTIPPKDGDQFTANSGYNGLTFPALAYLFLGGVIRDALGSQEKAIRFMQGCAGGASHMLPERLRTQKWQYCFVMDDPKNKDESNAYLKNGSKMRAFGGSASETTPTSSNNESANNWDTDPVGIFGAWDPSGRLGQVNIEMRKAAGTLSKKPGVTIARMLESLGKEHNPEWSKRY